MNTKIIDHYLTKKVKNTLQYANILLKKVYKQNADNDDIFEICIHRFINEFIIGNKDINEIEAENKNFFAKNNIKTEEQKRFAVIIIDVVTQRETPTKDLNFIDNIALFSEVLAISLEIEQQKILFTGNDPNYDKTIETIKKKYEPLSNEQLEHNLQISNKELKKQIKTNTNNNKKVLKLIKNIPFAVQYYEFIREPNPPNSILEIRLKNKEKELMKFSNEKIKEIMTRKNLIYEYALIMVEIVSFNILESILKQGNSIRYAIRLPDDFFKKKTNKKEMLSLTSINEVKQKIYLEANYDQIDKYYDDILELKNNQFQIVISNIKTKDRLSNKKLAELANYIVIDPLIEKDIGEIKAYSLEKKIPLFERDIGKEVILE